MLIIPIMRWILFMILRLMQFRTSISFGMAIELLTIIVIMDLTSLPGLVGVIGTIMHMVIMTIGLVLPIKAGRIAVKGITSMVGIVMILIMIEAVEEMVVGGGVDLVIEIGIRVRIEGMTGKEIKALIEGMNAHDHVDVTITIDRGPLEVEAMAEVIERIALMMLEMKGLRGDGTAKRGITESLILLYDSLLCVLVNFLIWVVTSLWLLCPYPL